MFLYLVIDVIFFVAAAFIVVSLRVSVSLKRLLATLIIMTFLTLIFDSLMIALGLFHYDPRHILGIHLGAAPIEDFAYPIVAVILVPCIWERMKHE